MYAKLLVLVLFATLTAAVLLTLRHQRYQAMHEMTRLHRVIQEDRQQMWQSQAQLARELAPQAIAEAVRRAQLPLAPLTPPPTPAEPVQTARAGGRASVDRR